MQTEHPLQPVPTNQKNLHNHQWLWQTHHHTQQLLPNEGISTPTLGKCSTLIKKTGLVVFTDPPKRFWEPIRPGSFSNNIWTHSIYTQEHHNGKLGIPRLKSHNHLHQTATDLGQIQKTLGTYLCKPTAVSQDLPFHQSSRKTPLGTNSYMGHKPLQIH